VISRQRAEHVAPGLTATPIAPTSATLRVTFASMDDRHPAGNAFARRIAKWRVKWRFAASIILLHLVAVLAVLCSSHRGQVKLRCVRSRW